MTGSWDRLVRWLLYFCPDDPVDSWGKKLMDIYHHGEEISTSYAGKALASWGRGGERL